MKILIFCKIFESNIGRIVVSNILLLFYQKWLFSSERIWSEPADMLLFKEIVFHCKLICNTEIKKMTWSGFLPPHLKLQWTSSKPAECFQTCPFRSPPWKSISSSGAATTRVIIWSLKRSFSSTGKPVWVL